MINHVVTLRLREDAPSADVDALIEALAAVSRLTPGVVDYRLGRDAGLREGNDHLAIVACFTDSTALKGYLSHPGHLAALSEYAPRLLAEKHSVQFESDDD